MSLAGPESSTQGGGESMRVTCERGARVLQSWMEKAEAEHQRQQRQQREQEHRGAEQGQSPQILWTAQPRVRWSPGRKAALPAMSTLERAFHLPGPEVGLEAEQAQLLSSLERERFSGFLLLSQGNDTNKMEAP